MKRRNERTERGRERERRTEKGGTNQPPRGLSSARRAGDRPSVYASALWWAARVKTGPWVANRRDTSSTVRWKLLLREGARQSPGIRTIELPSAPCDLGRKFAHRNLAGEEADVLVLSHPSTLNANQRLVGGEWERNRDYQTIVCSIL